MTFFRSTLLFCASVAVLLAQNPTPKPAPAPPPVGLTPPKPAPAPAVPPDRVVITVGENKLTAAQFDQIVDSLPEQYRALARGQGRKDFAENLVRIFVLADEGKRRKLNDTPEYKTQAEFQTANILAGKTFTQIGNGIKFDDAEVRQYYEAHKSEYEMIHARHILIRAAGSPVPADGKKELTEQEALAKAQEIRQKLVGGADFATLASQESDDTGSKANGGDLNFFRHGQMVPPFEEAAFALKVGEISQPVKTPFGYHIIKVEARKSFEDVKADVEKKMRAESAQKSLADLEKKEGVTLDPEFFGTVAK